MVDGMRSRRTPVLLPLFLLAAVCHLAFLGSTDCAFLPGPSSAAKASIGTTVAGAAAALIMPFVARAELPPLEDLPLDEIAPMRKFGPDENTFMGVSFPMVLGLIFIAVCWASFWVTNLMPKKDEEGVYKTYIGAGNLPPEGYTNPLDPRMSEEYDIDGDDDLSSAADKAKGSKSANSAIV